MKKASSERVHEFFCSLIGSGKQFEKRTRLTDFLQIPRSQATKFFDFLDGKEPKYKAVFDWLDIVGAQIILPGEDAEILSVDCFKKLEKTQAENERLKQRILELEAEVKVQQRLIDKAYPAPASLSFSADQNRAAG